MNQHDEAEAGWPRPAKQLLAREIEGLHNGKLDWCNECVWPKPTGSECANCTKAQDEADYHGLCDELEGLD